MELNTWNKPDPKIKYCWWIKGILASFILPLFFGGPMISLFIDSSRRGLFYAGVIYSGFVLAINMVVIVWAIMFYNRYAYYIGNDGIRIKKGILWKRDAQIPYERVQHVTSRRGPIEQIFGLHIVNIFTAGTASVGNAGPFGHIANIGAEGQIPGVRNPDEIKKIILDHVRGTHTSGLGDRTSTGITSEESILRSMLDELVKLRKLMEKGK